MTLRKKPGAPHKTAMTDSREYTLGQFPSGSDGEQFEQASVTKQEWTVQRINRLVGRECHARTLAAAQHELWGGLTGHASVWHYRSFLQSIVMPDGLPATLVACDGNQIAGSVNLLDCDLPLRADLSPWLGQLYVFPEFRHCGVGEVLVRAALAEASRLGWSTLYLFTSGTLPAYYSRLGWQAREIVMYQGAARTVMEIQTNREQ